MIERTTPDAFVTEARTVLARHADERERVARGDASPAYADALAVVHQAEREQLARTMLALVFPASKRPPVC